MDPYWLFLKTVVSTMVTLIGTAVVLFTAAPGPDVEMAQGRSAIVRASLLQETARPAEPSQASADSTRARVVDALVGALKDTDTGVRRHAAVALGEIGDKRAVAGLVAALADRDREVRRAVATALGELGDPSAIDALTRAMKDEDPEVRRRAVIAISELASDSSSVRGNPHPHPAPTPAPNPNPRPRPRPAGV